MEHEICIQCGAEVRPEEAYHVAEETVCPSCAETDTVVCSYLSLIHIYNALNNVFVPL